MTACEKAASSPCQVRLSGLGMLQRHNHGMETETPNGPMVG